MPLLGATRCAAPFTYANDAFGLALLGNRTSSAHRWIQRQPAKASLDASPCAVLASPHAAWPATPRTRPAAQLACYSEWLTVEVALQYALSNSTADV